MICPHCNKFIDTKLTDLDRQAMDEMHKRGWSSRRITAAMASKGKKVSHTLVWRLVTSRK